MTGVLCRPRGGRGGPGSTDPAAPACALRGGGPGGAPSQTGLPLRQDSQDGLRRPQGTGEGLRGRVTWAGGALKVLEIPGDQPDPTAAICSSWPLLSSESNVTAEDRPAHQLHVELTRGGQTASQADAASFSASLAAARQPPHSEALRAFQPDF